MTEIAEQTAPAFHVVDDPAAAVAELLAAEAKRGGTLVLTGGSAVDRAYELAALHQPDWSQAAVFWGDERCVPPDDELSNYALARRTLLDRLARLPDVHRIRGELDPAEAAAEYEAAVKDVILDLVLLGLGPDGHIASLFHGSPQLHERSRLVTDGPPGLEPFVHRVTLTLPALVAARRIVLLVTGQGKAEAVQRAFRDPISEEAPGSLLRTGPAPIDIYLDAAAAGAR